MQLQQIAQRKEGELVTDRRSHHQSSCIGAALAAWQVIWGHHLNCERQRASTCLFLSTWKTRCFCLTLPVNCEKQGASARLFLSSVKDNMLLPVSSCHHFSCAETPGFSCRLMIKKNPYAVLCFFAFQTMVWSMSHFLPPPNCLEL